MAGIDINNVFPNSKMAQAARLGQSRFRSVEAVSIAATYNPAGGAIISGGPGSSSGVFTLNTPGTKTTANLLAAAGLTTNFTSLSIGVVQTTSGVTIAQGSGSAVYLQGSIVNLSNVSVATNPVTITMAVNDIVSCTYSGT